MKYTYYSISSLLCTLAFFLIPQFVHAQTAVKLLDWTATAPATWEVNTPSNNMRLAQFTTPSQEEEKAAEVVIFYFGNAHGGSLDANIQRWASQFTNPDGTHPKPAVKELTGTPFKTTLVTLKGAYARRVGMGGDVKGVPGQMLHAAVMETPKGNFFFQIHGPEKAVMQESAQFLKFVCSTKTTEE